MRNIKRIVLTLLAMLPIASISTAAYSQVNALSGEDQTDLLRQRINQARRLLFKKGAMMTTIAAARQRLADQTGITDDELLEEELSRQVQILLDQGLIETNEVFMQAGTPSEW